METLDNLRNTKLANPTPGEIWDLEEKKKWKKSAKRNATCEGIVCKI